MAQITVVFKDFEEMKLFAREILKTPAGQVTSRSESVSQAASVQQPVQQPAPVPQPAPVQKPMQAAQTAPAQQSIPVTQTVPITQPVAAPVPAPMPAPIQQVIPTVSQSYTLDDLARAAMTLMDVGRQGDLQALLGQFGVEALPQLPKEQYGAFATALRGLGAKI